MKHFTQTTANGLHTPPCGSSHGNLSSFTLLTSLLLFFLLFVGSNAAWAGWRFQGQDGSNDGGAWNNGDNMTQVGSSDVWYYKISNLSSTIEFKINNGSWNNEDQKYFENNYDDQHRGNVPLVCGHDNDSKHRFRYEPNTIFGSNLSRDLYIFVKGNASSPSTSDKVWAIAVRPGSGTINKQYSLRGDLWLGSVGGGWAGTADLSHNPTFVNMTNDVAAQCSYLIPIPSGSNAMKSRFTLVSAGTEKSADHYEAESSNLTNNSDNKKYRLTIPANGGSYPTVKRIVLDYYPTNGYVRAHLEDYIVKRDGWHLYVDDKYMGAMSNSGSFTIESMASGTHTMYIANYSHNSINSSTYDPYSDGGGKIHAQQWFGGLYIDVNPAHSNVTFENKTAYYNNGNDYFGPQTYPIAGTQDARGQFKISGTKDVTFTFDGGVITINAVDHVEAFSGDFYVYGAGSNAQNWVTGWSSTDQGGGKSNPANHMTITNNVARKTYYGVKGDNLEFKVSNGTNDVGTWSNYSTSKQSGVSASANGQNIRFSLSNASDVTVCYDGANVWLEVEERQKPNDAWRVTGTFNSWSIEDDQMENDATNRCKKVTLGYITKAYDKNGHGWVKFKLFKGTAWDQGQVNHDNATIIGLDGTVIGTNDDDNESPLDGRIMVQVDEPSDITFSYYTYSNGTKVITVKRVATTVTPITYTGKEYMFLSKTQENFADGNVFTFSDAGAHLFVYFWNAINGTSNWSDEAFFWDNGNNVLAAKVPAGSWTHCKIVRKDNCCNGKDWNNIWNKTRNLFIESGKNYLQTGESSVWDVYTPPFYLTGTETLCGGNWGNTWPYGGLNNTVYSGSVTRENIPAGTYQFKLNPTKDYSSNWGHSVTDAFIPANSAGSNVTLSAGGGGNIQFELSNPSDVTIAYDGNGVTVNAVATAVVQHTVTFMDGEAELTELAQNIVDGGTVTEPSAPTKDGYTFVKWQRNGVDYNFSSAVDGDITLDAVWVAKTLESISLDESSIVMVMGGSNATLTPSYLPTDLIAGQQPTYDWSVSPSGVVTVDGGVITAVAEGTATVTCTAHGTDKSANCVVTVKDCNTEPTDIFTYTLGSDPTGIAAGSAAMNGMFDEADNNEPAELTMVTLALRYNQGDKCWVYDVPESDVGTQIRYTKQNSTPSADQYYWYRKEIGKTGSNLPIYVFKNVLTGHYLAKAEGGGDNNWSWVQAISASTYEYNTAQWHEATSSGNRLMNLDRSDGDATYTKKDYFLHCKNIDNSNTDGTHIVVGSSDGDQGDDELKFGYPTSSEVANPAYMHSPVSGYYRFATGASVVATLNRAIKVNDVIRLEVKNPSDAVVSATVTIGSQVANINLAAGVTRTETITVTDGSRPTSITIASDDVNFMLKSVVVNREMPNPAKNPNLAWSDTPSAAHQVADGDISNYIATRSGAGLITYTSSDESIATVADNGTVHPIAEGTVTITATLEQDGCYNGGTINYSLTLNDLPKPNITLTVPNAEVPQGSVQTISASQDGNGVLSVSILSGSDATLTDNGNGTYTLRLGDNASNIVIEAATTRTLTHAQHAVTQTVAVTNCAPDGRIIYSYTLSGHDDLNAAEAEGGTYSQANLASVGTDDNPKTVSKVRIGLGDQNSLQYVYDPNTALGNHIDYGSGNTDDYYWYVIPKGMTNSSIQKFALKNASTGYYLAKAAGGGTGDWDWVQAISANSCDANTAQWHWAISHTNNNHPRLMNMDRSNGDGSFYKPEYFLHRNTSANNGVSKVVVGSSDGDQGNGELNAWFRDEANANNPDYFYSVENDNHTYYILKGGSVTVSRASAFKASDVITLNVFNRGEAASSTIKVAENTIADNVNGAAELTYTVVAEDGIEGLNSFVITPLNEYICLNSISIFRPKDESEFINPTLTWDADLSEQQMIDMNNSETGMTHAIASIDAPVNAAVVYSVSPADKANINSATGALTLTGEALNKDVLTVTATLPAIGCYNEAQAAYEIYVKNLAMPTLSAAFGTLQQGFASTLTVTTNSDAVPALSNINGFAVNGDPSHEGDNYIYNIVVNNTVESASVHVALSETSDYLAAATDAEGSVTTSSLEDLYENTPDGGTLVLDANYNEGLVINKAITINGGGHSIGNLKVENEGDLTLSSALTVADFTICAKAGNTTTPAASGQVRNASNLTVDGEAYFLYTVDPSGHVQFGWYDFTVPFPVNVMTGIKGIQEGVLKENFVNETDYAIMEHLGDKQAAGQYAYKKFRGVMQPNKLYSITLDDEYNYNTIRFQKTNDGALVASDEVTLNTYASTVDNKHANWNGVGNGTLHHADAGLSVATIQVYQSGNKTFLPVDRTQYSLVIGSAFMVQQAGTMTLNQATHSPLLAPKREASVQPTAIQIASEGKPFSDQLFISADETAGQGYTQGVDVAKAGNIGNVNVPQIWTNAYNSKLCAHEAQLINGEAQYALSLYAPANGSYTLTSTSIPAGTTLYLTQNDHIIWDMSENYTFDLNKGTTTEYGLLLVQSHKIPTGIENGEWTNDEGRKVLHNGILYILHNGKVFNAQGAVIK